MSSYIDVDKAIEYAKIISKDTPQLATATRMICEYIQAQPTADVAPVVHAHWTRSHIAGRFCSNCEGYGIIASSYCPDCGAKMDEKTEQ